MSDLHIFISILLMSLVTIFLRFCPFLLFPNGKTVPRFITWLGNQLPKATMAMLIVYCLKDVRFNTLPGWFPAMIGVAVTAVLHLWKKQMIISIVGGTAAYMVLLRLIA